MENVVKDTASPPVPSGRAQRITERTRSEGWKKPPRRIETSECITCDTCLRSCPSEFGAIFDIGLDVVIIPELCSGCPACVLECPVDCIYVDENWTPTDESVWNHIELTTEGA
ncbi:4Fe-4S ferredoxin [Streptomyces hyaluromycini]|uniref:4Fe-4S ferredoxin n=1 Tax=Streptomyces hyaluromycini TaxID=1377993 RepID=UPI001237D8FB|nr:4Fe-4S ferredoxin [Streptomyces hyaluromycini]